MSGDTSGDTMSGDTGTHRERGGAFRSAMGRGDGSFEQAFVSAFEHAFDHSGRRHAHVPPAGLEGEERPLRPGASPTLR